ARVAIGDAIIATDRNKNRRAGALTDTGAILASRAAAAGNCRVTRCALEQAALSLARRIASGNEVQRVPGVTVDAALVAGLEHDEWVRLRARVVTDRDLPIDVEEDALVLIEASGDEAYRLPVARYATRDAECKQPQGDQWNDGPKRCQIVLAGCSHVRSLLW